MPIDFEFDFKKPNYEKVFILRAERLARFRANPTDFSLAKLHYKNNPAQFIIDWGCTFDPRNVERGLPAVIPFLLFPRQEEWIDFIMESWKDQEPTLTVKSRDMGLSWLSIALASTLSMFNRDMVIGFGSRKEEYVDKIGAPKSLFYKARMFSKMVPQEFRAGFDDAKTAPHMRIMFPGSGSAIIGESGDGIGRGDRASIYFVDESAFLERPQLIEASLSQTTNCRADISTPNGSNNPFAIKIAAGKIRQFVFHWRDDPRKDDAWYKKQKRVLDQITIAQEVDIDFNASVEFVLIPSAWVQSAIDAHIKLGIDVSGEKISALDVADRGKDSNAQSFRDGMLLTDVDVWHGTTVEDIFGTTQKAIDNCETNRHTSFYFDSDGLGVSCRGDARVINEIREEEGLHKITAIPFNGSGEVINKEAYIIEPEGGSPGRTNESFFATYKSQCWWHLRELFKETHEAIVSGKKIESDKIISISSTCKNLTIITTELSQPTYKKNNRGKILINKAPDGAKSPNGADSVMMLYAPHEESLTAGLIF